MTFKLKTDAVTEALEAAVAAKGEDYHYRGYVRADQGAALPGSCSYANEDGSPSCIVGHVVAALDPRLFAEMVEAEKVEGFPVTELKSGVDIVQYDEYDEVERQVFIEPVKSDGPELFEALRVAQVLQDNGHSWGEALEAYRRTLAGEDSYTVELEIKARYRK